MPIRKGLYNTRVRRLAASAVILSLAIATLGAHHAIGAIYDASRPVTLEGSVSGVRFAPPHPFVEIDVERGGKPQRWRLELDNHFELVGVGMTADTLKAGDKVTVTGSSARNGDRSVYVRSLERPADGFVYEQVGSSPRVRFRK
jgi:hypothetical protein